VNEQEKRDYKARYDAAKQHGVKFFPDIIYKDMIVSFGLFLLLVGLATFVGVKAEPPADPSDSTYVPRPEWYFLFLFELLKFFPGKIEWVGTAVVPLVAVLALLLLPFYDRRRFRHWRSRILEILIMGFIVAGVLALTVAAAITTPKQEEFSVAGSIGQQYAAGEELYGIQCVECHGPEGQGGEITTVEGLEGVVVPPLNAPDFIYTRTDETIYQIINYGQQDLGMPPFGLAYGGELQKAQIDAIVTFIRYAWDDRVELPKEAAVAGVPSLGPDEIPTFTVHVEPVIRRACLSCHRPGKKNGNYWMRTYDEVLTTGDYAPNFVAGDLDSNAILMINGVETDAGGQMPPTGALKPEWLDIFERWVLAGMPETPEDLPTAVPGSETTQPAESAP
jgi:menaquinol-cytochrome c reductase cytochrome b/c subunit